MADIVHAQRLESINNLYSTKMINAIIAVNKDQYSIFHPI